MSVRNVALSTEASPRPAQTREIQLRRLYRAGYRATLLLAFTLPFEVKQRPRIRTSAITVTNLKMVLYMVVALATASLIRPLAALVQDILAGRSEPARCLYRQRLTLALLAVTVRMAERGKKTQPC